MRTLLDLCLAPRTSSVVYRLVDFYLSSNIHKNIRSSLRTSKRIPVSFLPCLIHVTGYFHHRKGGSSGFLAKVLYLNKDFRVKALASTVPPLPGVSSNSSTGDSMENGIRSSRALLCSPTGKPCMLSTGKPRSAILRGSNPRIEYFPPQPSSTFIKFFPEELSFLWTSSSIH